jgi:adenine phosphoribosyltransferase
MESSAGQTSERKARQGTQDGRLDPVLEARVRQLIAVVPNFPKPGIKFRDISPILERDPVLFRGLVDAMIQPHVGASPDVIVCIESWGYLFGAPLAYALGSRIVLARRAGKLPRPTLGQTYDMGYATQLRLELHADAIQAGENVLVVDDVLATGGTALAAVNLVAQTGAQLVGVSVAIDIEEWYRFPARRILEERGITIFAAAHL